MYKCACIYKYMYTYNHLTYNHLMKYIYVY